MFCKIISSKTFFKEAVDDYINLMSKREEMINNGCGEYGFANTGNATEP